MPALALMTTSTAVVSALLQSPIGSQEVTGRTGLGATFFVANLVIYRTTSDYFAFGATLNPLLHTWSLSVEEQFYLVFPIVLLIGWVLIGRRIGSRARGAALALVAVGGLSFLFCISLVRGLVDLPFLQNPLGFAFFSSATRAWEFAAGAALVFVGRRIAHVPRVTAQSLGVGGFLLVALGAFFISDRHPYPGFEALAPVLGTCMLLMAGTTHAGGVSRLLSRGPMVWIGDLSYSWYLWHWPLLVFTRLLWPELFWLLPLVAVGALIPSWLSYRFVESPLRRDQPRSGKQFAVVAFACLTIPAIACFGLLVGANAFWGSENARSTAAQIQPMHAADTIGCTTPVPLDRRPVDSCTWNSSALGTPLYLVGDSNASQFSEAMIGVSTKAGAPLVVGAMSGCEFVEARQIVDGTENTACRTWVTKSTRWLTEQAPGVVVISDVADLAIAGDGLVLVSSDGSVRASSPDEKAALWKRSLGTLVGELTKAGHVVILVQPIPRFYGSGDKLDPTWRIESCIRPVLTRTPERCGQSRSVDAVAKEQLLSYGVKAGAAAIGGASILDLRSEICGQAVCQTNEGRDWFYRDGQHISVSTSLRLSNEFARAVAAAQKRGVDFTRLAHIG